MKEILLFTLASSVDQTIYRLGELGVVEIKEMEQAYGERVTRLCEEIERTQQAIQILEPYIDRNQRDGNEDKYPTHDPKRIVDRVLVSGKIKQQVEDKHQELVHQLSWYQTWGEQVGREDIEYLAEKGVFVRLYRAKKGQVDKLGENKTLVSFPVQGADQIPVALFTRDREETLPLKPELPPERPAWELRQQIQRKQRQVKEIELYLEDQAENVELMREYLQYLQDQLKIQRAMGSMGDVEDKVRYLRGFIPRDAVDRFEALAQKEHWGYQISDPDKPEEVPVYVKNPKWISIINPVMKFIDIVPGYKEVDVSIYFLVAFALFFAMLVGDAGYGAIFLLLTILFGKKFSPQMRFLIYVLSSTTIIWGVLSGTYFGSEKIAAIPFLNDLIIEEIASFGVDNISFMMHLSFLIGAIHLTIAHGIRVVQFINSIKALSELGWIALVWGLFFVTEQLVLGRPMPGWSTWVFAGGAVLVIFFSVERKNFFQSMLVSFSNLPLSLISGFSDIVSYVRLFAVGLATAAVASSFNNMILPNGVANLGVVELIMAAVALFLGHGLNIVLALMAVMVHGIRLNMLEFAGHLGVQFSGEAYKPFKLLTETRDYSNA